MSQTIRITVTSEMEKALQILRQSTMGTLNTTELIKMAVGSLARIKRTEKNEGINPNEIDLISSRAYYDWSKDDDTLDVPNIAHPDKLKPFTPKPYVRTR